jgi:ATP-dependent Clp protease ATP-binding subunit ClpC
MFTLSPAASALLDLAAQDAEQRGEAEFGLRNIVLAALELGFDGPLGPVFHVRLDRKLKSSLEVGYPPRAQIPRMAVAKAKPDATLEMALAAALARGDVDVRQVLTLPLADRGIRDLLARLNFSPDNLLEQAEDSKVPHTARPSAGAAAGAAVPVESGGQGGGQSQDVFATFGRDLTAMAKKGELRGATGRAAEIERLCAALGRMSQNNPLLVGLPGTGKTAVVEQFAIDAAAGKWPHLKEARVVEIDLAGMVAGTKYRGEFEQRLKSLITGLQSAGGQIIPFIDEIHMLVGAGGAEGSMDAANMLKPPLARGELRVIGATTPSEYRTSIEKDPALARRFNVVRLNPPSAEETKGILRAALPRFEKHHGVPIDVAAADEAVRMADRYITNRNFPDKALFLLDDAAASSRLKSPGEKVGELAVYEAVQRVTGVPVSQVNQHPRERRDAIVSALKAEVVGQPDALTIVTSKIDEMLSGMVSRNQPVPGLLFVGPSGTGKTHLAKTFATEFFHTDGAYHRYDMSEYAGQSGHASLLGAAMGLVGSERGGILTNALRQYPHALYLFDEIEKGERETLNIFLGVLESGTLTGRDGVEVDCRHALFAFTSNLGARLHNSDKPWEELRELYSEELRKTLPPELLGRMEIIPFRPLGDEAIISVLRLQLREIQQQAKDARQLAVTFTDDCLQPLAKLGRDDAYGARALRRIIAERVKRPLVAWMLQAPVDAPHTIKAVWDSTKEEMTFVPGPKETAA